MSLYDVNGNEITIGGDDSTQARFTVKRNSEALVNEFLTVARSYLGQDSIVYKDGDTIFYKSTSTNGIDCSTYVGLCLMGYPFNKSPYATGNYISPYAWVENSDFSWALPTIRYSVSRFIDGHNPTEIVRLACQLARWMYNRNQVVPLTDGFRDVLPGDIVFWGHRVKSTGEWVHPTWFKHINHVGIILSKENAPDTYEYTDDDGVTHTANWDKTKYPYKHGIIEVGVSTPPCRATSWLEKGQENATNVYRNDVNSIQLICRPDLGTLDSWGE